MATYIIEHLEPEIWEWCLYEYKHISNIVGKENLWITNVNIKDKNFVKLKKFARVFEKSVADLSLDLKRVCILDAEGGKELKPAETSGFDYYVFGWILGDSPPRKRTGPELTVRMKGASVRNLGKEQFPTDNAVYVVKEIVSGIALEKMKFKDGLTIKLGDGKVLEEFILPFKYVLVNGKPLISQKVLKYLRSKKGF